MWYEDLSECDYGGTNHTSVVFTAVGWLENRKVFSQGKTPKRVYEKLLEFSQNAWQFYLVMGYHRCDFCERKLDTKGEVIAESWRTSEKWGVNNITIPHNGKLFHFPEMITHYIKEHSYLPPKEFCEAVLACPPMNTIDYFNKMVENGAESIIKEDKERFTKK